MMCEPTDVVVYVGFTTFEFWIRSEFKHMSIRIITEITKKHVFIHPKYQEYLSSHNGTNPYDLALIRLPRSVNFTAINRYYSVNTICLPQVNDTQEEDKLAQVAAWGRMKGKIFNYSLGNERFQIGYINVMKISNDVNDNYGRLLRLVRTDNTSALLCKVSQNLILYTGMVNGRVSQTTPSTTWTKFIPYPCFRQGPFINSFIIDFKPIQ